MERYSKIKRIGSGTFGQAWLVESTVSKRTYALKELGVTAMSEQDRHLALNEAKILSKLKHKNIVRYKEAFVDQGKMCIAMEFAEKGDLYTRIRERNGLYFSETQILEWFTQLCLALKYIHGQNILHRDLKTQNIFLGKEDIIKLGDFGIARVLNSTLDHAQTTVGTPYYLSPEICQRKPYNHKSDMWSLGCVLYEMATLKHAFNANNFSALVIKILQGQYPPIPGCYGPLLEDLVSVLLQKNPDDRPSAKQLLYVPAMQPYVKRLLQYERERADSVASDISDISSSSNVDCPRSRISSSGKTEKEHCEENMVKSSNVSNQDSQVKQNSNITTENSRRSSSRERRFSTNKAPIVNVQGNCRSHSSGPNVCVADNAPKTRITFPASDNTSKARENLPTRCPADTKKRSLLALAHAHQRRHSEQTSAQSQPGSRISKCRIYSQGAQFLDNSENENDVVAVNYPTVIPKRKPGVTNVSKPQEFKNSKSNASASCANGAATITEEPKLKPAMSLCQPKSSEVMRTKMRHQSAATTDSNRCAIEQKHRRLTIRSEMNRVNKENGAPSQAQDQATTRRRYSSSAMKQIQTPNTENQPTVKTNSEATGNEREIRKRTYTVSQERRPSAFEIPDVDRQRKHNDGNGSCKGGKGSSKEGNGSRHVRVLRNEKLGLRRDSGSKICENHFNHENMVHVTAETTGLENKRKVLPPSCKFTFCGKTLHLDNVSSHDSIYSHLEALRMYLEKELGTRLLTAVYRYVTNVSLEEHDRVKQTVTAMLGEDKMMYFPVLLQLVACEAIYFH